MIKKIFISAFVIVIALFGFRAKKELTDTQNQLALLI